MKETELAQHFINYFEGFEIFKEVPACGIIDFVAKSGNITTSVEVKCSLNFDVIEQAYNNLNSANYSYIAVPKTKNRSFALQICKQYGIGVLQFDETKRHHPVLEVVKPRLNRKIKKLKLHEWQKESVAGSQNERMTAFKNTIREIGNYLDRRGGRATMKQLLNDIPTHYGNIRSANHCIQDLIRRGEIKELGYEGGVIFKIGAV